MKPTLSLSTLGDCSLTRTPSPASDHTDLSLPLWWTQTSRASTDQSCSTRMKPKNLWERRTRLDRCKNWILDDRCNSQHLSKKRKIILFQLYFTYSSWLQMFPWMNENIHTYVRWVVLALRACDSHGWVMGKNPDYRGLVSYTGLCREICERLIRFSGIWGHPPPPSLMVPGSRTELRSGPDGTWWGLNLWSECSPSLIFSSFEMIYYLVTISLLWFVTGIIYFKIKASDVQATSKLYYITDYLL